MVGVGNHEYDFYGQPFSPSWGNYNDDSRGECGNCGESKEILTFFKGVPYTKRFVMPQNGNLNNWYSMDYPLVHVIFFSTEHDFMEGSEQYKWIEQDLSSVDRSKQWTIVCGHRPMYTSNSDPVTRNMGEQMRIQLEPLFVKYSVDLGLWGHVHSYERSCPVINGTCKVDNEHPKGPVHIVIGMAGQTYSSDWIDSPEWSMFRAIDYGYARIHIPSRDKLHFEYVGDIDGGVHDDVWIYNN